MKAARARTNLQDINDELQANLAYFKDRVAALDDPEARKRWIDIETFCAIAIRVMVKTNPSKLRDIARTLEIYAHMHEGKLFNE